MQTLSTTLRNLVTNERGNIAITFGLTSLIAMSAVGGAVDFGRAYQQKSKMQNALDAAVVSAVSKYKDTGNWTLANTTALNTFRSIYTNAVAKTTANPNPTASLDQPIVQFTQSGQTIVGSATLKANTPFMKLAIGSDLQVRADSTGTPPAGKSLEVALMVDLTGSMGWDAAAGATAAPCNLVANPSDKIHYLKCAGEDLLNILLPASGANNSSVKIGIAPFSEKVNAGEYTAAVTGLNATGGTYTPITNLASTLQGPNSGTMTGSTASYGGFGATGRNLPSGGTSTAGATFSNSYCSNPTSTDVVTSSNYRTGVQVAAESGMTATVVGLTYVASNAASADKFKKISSADGSGDNWISYADNQHTGYFVPRPVSTSGRTVQERTGDVTTPVWIDPPGRNNAYWGSETVSKTGQIGVYVPNDGSYSETNLINMGFKKASSQTNGGYWKLTQVNASGAHSYTWTTSGFYLPLYTVTPANGTIGGCEGTTTTANSKLISCVTERVQGTSLNFTAVAPASGNYIGPYNHGSTQKSNYSSDGKCYVGGRELAPVIPLTNDRASLMSFFQNATVGGATAGHLGTAWASYILSPDFSTVWPTRVATAYDPAGTGMVKKAAILMTDGEYNIQFSVGGSASNTSAKQALMLCKQMRDQGIKVYTVGFGFAANAAPPTTNVEGMTETERTSPLTGAYTAQQKALDTLAKCASTNSSYYFPYDGQALRETFKSIANGLSSDLTQGKARLTN